MNMVKICFISYNLFSNKGGILEYLYSCMRFADRFGMLSLIACFLSSKWTCFRNMLDNQCGKRLLYFIETIFWDKLDNCFISYSPCTSIATGRYLIVFIDFPQIWKSTDEYGKTPFCVWLIYVPGMVFYIFFSPTSPPSKKIHSTWQNPDLVYPIFVLWLFDHLELNSDESIFMSFLRLARLVQLWENDGMLGVWELRSLFFQPKTESLRPKQQFINQIHMFSWWWAVLLWQCLCRWYNYVFFV